MPVPPALRVPSVVLDTNTVLDWLVFRDAGVLAVAEAIQGGRLRWLACGAMRDELARTLAYPSLTRWNPDSERTLSVFDQFAERLPMPVTAPMAPRCSDLDDQVFIDLALAHHARWLLTHDRALLRLARHARRSGLCVTQARNWQPE